MRKKTVLWLAVLTAVIVLTTVACESEREAEVAVDDATIVTRIKTKLAADPEVNPFVIDVDASQGVVRLSGTVATEADRSEALELARDTDGVVRVIDELQIGDVEAEEVVDDAVLAANVKSVLAADPEVGAFEIDVDAEAGVVTLTGGVSSEYELDHAVHLAERVEGVQQVESRLVVESGS